MGPTIKGCYVRYRVCCTFHTSSLITRPLSGSNDQRMVCWNRLLDGIPSGFMGPAWAPSSGLAILEGCYKAMKSEDVIVKSEGTLHTSLIDN